MHSCWLSSEKVGERKQEVRELGAHGKTRTHCGTMESCPTFPQFHSTAAPRKMVILYMIDTALKKQRQRPKNSLDQRNKEKR